MTTPPDAGPPNEPAAAGPPWDALVVGAGPAGLTTALYLRRYHRRVLLADHGRSRAQWIGRSYNCPGFPEGVGGPELLARLEAQLAQVGGHVQRAVVQQLRRTREGLFEARVGDAPVSARHVVLATGVVDRLPPIAGARELRAAGRLRQCPICDGHEHRDLRIAVLGDGEHAQREAGFIAHYSARVSLAGIARPPTATAAHDPRVRLLPAPATALVVEGEAVRLLCQDGRSHRVDVVYAAMGVDPRIELALSLGAALDEDCKLVVDAQGRCSVPDLWAVGDVVSGLDQIAVALGHGAVTATAVHNALRAGAAG